MESLLLLLQSGLAALRDELIGKLSGAFLPAFFVAGGVGVFIPKSAVVRFLSPKANRLAAYLVASVAGAVLSVCSCGIIPLFAAFYEQGAGLGPAVTFLFAGPSINLISMFYAFYLLGPGMGSAIVLSVLATSILLGLTFERLAGARSEKPIEDAAEPLLGPKQRGFWATFHFFLFLLLMTLILPIEGISWTMKLLWVGLNLTGLGMTLKLYFSRDDVSAWVEKSVFLLKRLLPKIVLGIFVLGMLQGAQGQYPESFRLFREAVGTQTFGAALLASAVGAVVYMGSILAVVTVKALMAMGMASGPALAFVVAAPGVSFSTLFAVAEVIGMKRSALYFGLVILFSAAAGALAAAVGLV